MSLPDRTTLYQRLSTLPYFAGLGQAALDGMVDLAVWQEFAAGGVIFLEGDLNAGLYLLYRGWIKVIKLSSDGREQVLRYFGPGDPFHEIGIFLARPNPATAIALEPCGLWLLRRDLLQPALVAHPDVMLRVMTNMADRIAYLAGLVARPLVAYGRGAPGAAVARRS